MKFILGNYEEKVDPFLWRVELSFFDYVISFEWKLSSARLRERKFAYHGFREMVKSVEKTETKYYRE